jgi:hypothetical protein
MIGGSQHRQRLLFSRRRKRLIDCLKLLSAEFEAVSLKVSYVVQNQLSGLQQQVSAWTRKGNLSG